MDKQKRQRRKDILIEVKMGLKDVSCEDEEMKIGDRFVKCRGMVMCRDELDRKEMSEMIEEEVLSGCSNKHPIIYLPNRKEEVYDVWANGIVPSKCRVQCMKIREYACNKVDTILGLIVGAILTEIVHLLFI